jgi:hypothetical protein
MNLFEMALAVKQFSDENRTGIDTIYISLDAFMRLPSDPRAIRDDHKMEVRIVGLTIKPEPLDLLTKYQELGLMAIQHEVFNIAINFDKKFKFNPDLTGEVE